MLAMLHHMWLTWFVASLMSANDHWPVMNALAGRECVVVCMAESNSCFAHGLGLGFSMSTLSTAACILCATHLVGFEFSLVVGCVPMASLDSACSE